MTLAYTMDVDQTHRRIRRWKISADAHGQLDVVDPPGHPQWTLGQNSGVPPGATVSWLDAMTNAIDDGSARGLGWR